MSKISVKKSIQSATQSFWKRCEGLVTEFAYNYRSNIFFRTTVKVVVLLFAFAGSILGVVAVGIQAISNDFESSLADGLHQATGVRKYAVLREINEAIASIPSLEVVAIVGVMLLVIVLFGMIVAKIALRPTREALASQKQFIGNIAHELRTPLSIVKTNIEVALLNANLDKELRTALRDNVDELDRSSDIINNLLSLNTLLNPSNIPFGNVDLGNTANEAMEKLIPLAVQRGVKLAIEKKEFLIVRGNNTALVQVAGNLIKNAITHTPKGGSVSLLLQPDYRGYIELRVSDTGVGIPEKDLLHIFEPFYQADPSRAKSYGGSGLGLTIVSEIVKLHGGKILMQSTEKRGTTAIVSIPCGDTQTGDPSTFHEHAQNIAMDFSKNQHPAIRK